MKRTIELPSGLWSRVDRMAKHINEEPVDLIEHCLVKRIRQMENYHIDRIQVEKTRHANNPVGAKSKISAKTRKTRLAKKMKHSKLRAVA